MEGVSTRKGDDLVQALALSGGDKSKVSRIYEEDPAAGGQPHAGARGLAN